ncbi:MAG TPA: LysR family transcriptional regulator [Polyangiaceae bacterium]|jgi:DNA-binding transcriptional LysR family regulator
MDRLDAMTAFVTTVDAGSLSGAARKLSRSPASITRAVSALEEHTGALLLRRTTRTVRLTEAGERYLVACRRILAELAEADALAAGEDVTPRGSLAVTAPLAFGRLHLRPVVDAFVLARREVQVRLLLLDRLVNLIDEGIDVAVRIAHLPDSSLVAVRVGEVRRVLCASPTYLARAPALAEPADLTHHDCVSFSQVTSGDVWSFADPGGGRARQVKVRPRLVVNSAEAAVGSVASGLGVTSALSYQVDRELREGTLVRLLPRWEPEPLPVHIVYPAASATSAKVRAFVDAATPALRAALATPSPRAPAPRAARSAAPRRSPPRAR